MLPSDALVAYHQFNAFLSTQAGGLLKSGVEAIILFLICYMVASEYGRERTARLRLLTIGLAILLIDAVLITASEALAVLAGNTLLSSNLPAITRAIELAGLALLTNAFMLAGLGARTVRVRIWVEIAIAAIVCGVTMLIAWTSEELRLSSIVFIAVHDLLRILLAGEAAVRIALAGRERFGRYARHIWPAFVVYAIAPMIGLLNILLFSYASGRLRILAHPFPILAVLLLFRIVYLQLVDKAMLKHRLHTTRKLYHHERELSSLKDEFVDTVSHELRTPLTSINLYADLLRKQVRKGGEPMLDVIKEQTRRLTTLVNDLLDLSRLQKGKLRIKPERCRLRPLIDRAAPEQLAANAKITRRLTIPARLTADADPDRLAQIITNLYSNAVKFTEPGGTITISARREKKRIIISVADTGVGIPPDKLEHLFDKFYQVGDHMTREKGGSGLGLAIAKELVELHGGAISVASRVGRGTRFTLALPISPGPQQR